jgi:hypothetical protein
MAIQLAAAGDILKRSALSIVDVSLKGGLDASISGLREALGRL